MGNDGKIDCRLCGERHRPGLTCPKFIVKGAPAAPRVVVIDNEMEQANAPDPQTAANTDPVAANTPPEPPKAAANKPKLKKRKPAPLLNAANSECAPAVGGIPPYCKNQRRVDVDRRREYMRNLMRRKREVERATK